MLRGRTGSRCDLRGTDVQGRFTIDFEASSIWEGIRDELASPVGVQVDWYTWEHDFDLDLVADDIYDTSNPTPGLGRSWNNPVKVPVVTAQIFQGQISQNDRGFYNVDTMRVVINAEDAVKFFPDILTAPDDHIKDRIVFRNEVFTPIRVYPRGHMEYKFAVVTIDCAQVNAEELVNDPQFQQFAKGSDVLAAEVPAAPTNVVAVADQNAATVTWTAPTNDGGSSVKSYTVSSDDGSISKTVTGTTCSFLLDDSKSYRFVVVATNRVGSGAVSAPSNQVVPL